jgi:CHASE2 domain-containing sensor protein
VTGAALAIVLGLLFVPSLADLSYDLFFRLRPNVTVTGAKVIYLDDLSARKLGQPWDNAAWDRTNHAQLLSRLKDCRAKAVVFDILFDRTNASDNVFLNAIAEALQAGTTVIVGGKIEVSGSGQYQMTNEFAPLPAFEKACPWGLAEWEIGNVPHRRHFPGTDRTPSLAGRTAELILKPPPRDLPAERWINFYGPPGFLPKCSYAQALDPLTPDQTFAQEVCFVGAWPTTPFAGGLRTDEWSTPYSRWGGGKAPGVEITATVYLNLMRHDYLTRLPVWNESLIVVLGGLLFGSGLALCRPTVATGLGILAALAVTAAACGWTWRQHVWFSWLVIAGVQIPTAVAWSALAYTKRLTREKAVLEEKLATAPPPALSRLQPAETPSDADDTPTIVRAGAPSLRPLDWMPAIPDHTLLRRIGKGAYGEVWLARNAIGTYHAVKIIRREDFEESEPFEREFRGLQKFMPISHGHPGLVLILHVGRHDRDGFIYYIMEAADDETTGPKINPDAYSPKNLAKEIRRRGHLPVAECRQLGLDLTAALDFLHEQKLIHRDIKPANIIYVKGSPKFADIGLVTDIATTGRNVTYLGTKGYIAPEGPGTPAADLYSLGKVLYEASMGMQCEMFPELPSTLGQRPDQAELLQLNKVLLKACRQQPGQRYQSAAEMREEL